MSFRLHFNHAFSLDNAVEVEAVLLRLRNEGIAAVPVGALATAILVVNNLRDVDTDRVAGKRTLAVRMGRGGARAEWALLVGVAYLIPILLVFGLSAENPLRQSAWVLLPWVSAPRALRLFGVIKSPEDRPTLTEALAGTAQSASLELLKCFAYGTWKDYRAAAGALPALSAGQAAKLKKLSVVTLASSGSSAR